MVAASPQRLVLQREFEQDVALSVHHLIAELYDGVDWVLVEGYRDCDLPKLEIWRAASGKPARYPSDPFIAAIATDSPEQLPEPTQRPVLDLNNADAVADWLLGQGERFVYDASQYEL